MTLKTQDVLPVIVSIIVIILVAVFEKQSKLFAAITATMPLGIPLALWIVYASNGGEKETVAQFTQGMVLSFLPTMAFTITIWLAARAGMKLVPILAYGYIVWALGTGVLVLLRRALGLG